ncbi:autotransporter outer membrane beta-barrel domain-containing protein [Candidatus Pelagibacter sp.]|nr:autotransporter outer membrane beta-barrel domain-containing protein [Candidatus Pelagibacter sp.]
MFLFKRILIIFFLFSPISNSFGAMVTHNQTEDVIGSTSSHVAGIEFNNDGTKMFTSYAQPNNGWGNPHFIQEYNLSTPYDISTRVYRGDSERCELTGTHTGNQYQLYDLEFSSDGMKFFIVLRNPGTDATAGDRVYGFDLTSPYDVSTCALATKQEDLDDPALTNGSNAGDFDHSGSNNRHHRVQSLEINDDGTKLFLTFFDAANADVGARLYEYNLSTPYDVSTLSIVTTAGIELPATINGATNPSGMRFSTNGKRIFIISHNDNNAAIVQISLSKAYDTSSFTIDGGLNLKTGLSPGNDEPRGVAFSASGLKLYIGNDKQMNTTDQIMEYDLVCPFNIIAGKCPPVTESSVRTGIAEAQIMIAKRTIDHSTKSALNRLKWIRRNKDNQNLTNLNINFNFNTATQLDNPLLNYWVKKLPDRIVSVNEKVEGGQSITINKEDMNSKNSNNFTTVFKSDNALLNSWLSKIPEKITAHQASLEKKTEDKQQDIFYWSEGSIAVGRVGDTNISSFKKIGTEAITLGADKFTDNNGIKGLAVRLGNNNLDVGMGGSNIDTDTFNVTYYSTTPLENDTKSEDIVIGFGNLKYDILTVLDGKHIKASRVGRQVYGAVKTKDEIKKNNFILIPSFQADVGHTILDGYTESGIGAIKVEDQNIQTLKLRTAMAMVENLSNNTTFCLDLAKTCAIKRHGKLEYMADLSRSSNFEYTYVSDQTLEFNEKLYSGALHNVNGEMGIDIILPNSLSVFLIYERNQALGSGHTDNINITIGYLPNKKTNYAFKVAGSDNLGSEYKLSKNINDFEIDFKLNNQDVLKPNTIDEAMVNLSRIF